MKSTNFDIFFFDICLLLAQECLTTSWMHFSELLASIMQAKLDCMN